MEWMTKYERCFKTTEGADICYIADAPHPLALDTDDMEKYHQMYNAIRDQYEGKFYLQPSNLCRPSTVHFVNDGGVIPFITVITLPHEWAGALDKHARSTVYDIVGRVRAISAMMDIARQNRQFRPADRSAGNTLAFYIQGESVQTVAHNRYLNTWHYEPRTFMPVMDDDIPRFFRGVESKFIEWTAITNCEVVSDIMLMEGELKRDKNARI